MTEELVRQVVLAALKGERGDGGWLKIDAPKASDKEISLAIMEAAERGLVKACDVSDMQSPYPEWCLVGPTGASARFIREATASRSGRADVPPTQLYSQPNKQSPQTEETRVNKRDVLVIHGRDE